MRRILVLDDEPNVALILQAGLESLPDCEVALATAGQDALQLFQEQPFDLLITDYQMPDMDGIVIARHIRNHYPATMIILITAYDPVLVRDRAACEIVNHILEKPVTLDKVRSVALETLAALP